MLKENYFKIKAYGKSQLAQIYYPGIPRKTAYYRLCRAIRRVSYLNEALNPPGKPTSWFYTPNEVKMIVDSLGLPESYFTE